MSRTTFYDRNYVGWPPVRISEYADPDSYHWKNQAGNYRLWLIQVMGEDAFLEFANRLFPGDSIEEATWKEIAELYEAKFRVLQAGERDCTCVLPEQDCPVCRATAREVYKDMIGG